MSNSKIEMQNDAQRPGHRKVSKTLKCNIQKSEFKMLTTDRGAEEQAVGFQNATGPFANLKHTLHFAQREENNAH